MPLIFVSSLDFLNPDKKPPPQFLNIRRFPQIYPNFRDFVNFREINKLRHLDINFPFLGGLNF